jgi:hypothetical protein
VREDLSNLEEAFEELLNRAFSDVPPTEAEKEKELLRRRTTRAKRKAEDWGDQTLIR